MEFIFIHTRSLLCNVCIYLLIEAGAGDEAALGDEAKVGQEHDDDNQGVSGPWSS